VVPGVAACVLAVRSSAIHSNFLNMPVLAPPENAESSLGCDKPCIMTVLHWA
jgi:hypothetical protein